MRIRFLCSTAVVVTAFVLGGCGGDDELTCGKGTKQSGSTCVASGSGTGGSGGSAGTGSGGTAGGSGGSAGSVSVAPTFAGVVAVAPASTTSLLITWAPATDTTTAPEHMVYNVYLATSAGSQNFGTPQLTSPPGATSVEFTGLVPNGDYFVVVRAENLAGAEDDNTVEESAKTVADTTAPTFAGVKTATAAGGGSVELSWDPATDDLTPAGAMLYQAFVGFTAGGVSFVSPAAISQPGASSVVVTGLPDPETDYFFVVRARDAAGNTDDNTVEVSGKTGADTVPPVFGGCILATTVSASSVDVVWTSAMDDSTTPSLIKYNVYASKTAGAQDFSKPPAGTFTGETHGLVEGLEPSTTYYFVCRAEDASGNEDANTGERSAKTSDDSSPPVFAGLTAVKNVTSSSVDLEWAEATDDKTPQADIVYDVFQGAAAGGQDFTKPPAATSASGATTVTVSGLASRTKYYWVVRARDLAGNRDSNTVEQNATTLVSFSADIETPIFGAKCAVIGCHTGGNPTGNMVLAPGFAYSNIVNVPSLGGGGKLRVKPNDPNNSYLYNKVTGTGIAGEIMPPPATLDFLTQDQKDTIKDWILEGAQNN
jgi:hypothetical protein